MFKKLKQKVVMEVINELYDFMREHDMTRQVKEEEGTLDDFELGIGSGIRKSITRVRNMLDYID